MAYENFVYIYHYGDVVKLRFGRSGPTITVDEKDLPDKIKYAIATRGRKNVG